MRRILVKTDPKPLKGLCHAEPVEALPNIAKTSQKLPFSGGHILQVLAYK
jgi:hypothetical protein